MDDKQGFKYTTTIDFDVASIYASKKCNDCYGRGVIITTSSPNGTIRKNDTLIENSVYCRCVHKNAKKYG